MKWLRKILGLCEHDFEIIETATLKRWGIVEGKVYVQKCKHCGKMHNHVFSLNEME